MVKLPGFSILEELALSARLDLDSASLHPGYDLARLGDP
jgi:hypothetical protein